MIAIFFFCLFSTNFVYGMSSDKMIAKGIWTVLAIEKCPDPEQYYLQYEVSKRKISRMKDGFDAIFQLGRTLDETYSMHADMCQFVDGGCKQFQEFDEDCFVCFINKYAEGNAMKLLALAGLDPPEFPVPEGDYTVVGYEFNSCELPREAVVGKFRVTGYVLNGTDPVFCTVLIVEFIEDDEEDDNECEGD